MEKLLGKERCFNGGEYLKLIKEGLKLLKSEKTGVGNEDEQRLEFAAIVELFICLSLLNLLLI